jgi:hypothetical protein
VSDNYAFNYSSDAARRGDQETGHDESTSVCGRVDLADGTGHCCRCTDGSQGSASIQGVRPVGAHHVLVAVAPSDAADPLTALAVLFEACLDGPPDDSPAYLSAMARAAEVLRSET